MIVVLEAYSGLDDDGKRTYLREKGFDRRLAERMLQKIKPRARCSIWKLKEGQGLVFKEGSLIQAATNTEKKKGRPPKNKED